MDTFLSLCLGIGLSAACGFRVFVPPLIMSIAAQTGHLHLAPSFAWIGTTPALMTFAAASVFEVAGYFIPWVDHLLDTLATPASVAAGTIMTAAMVSGLDPFLKWSLALIAGGGTAALIQSSTVLGRLGSTALTGGLGNPFFAFAELGGAVGTSLASLFLPVLGLMICIAGLVVLLALVRRRSARLVPNQAPVLSVTARRAR